MTNKYMWIGIVLMIIGINMLVVGAKGLINSADDRAKERWEVINELCVPLGDEDVFTIGVDPDGKAHLVMVCGLDDNDFEEHDHREDPSG